jgi:transcriptional regulator with XRE-family HTH domain
MPPTTFRVAVGDWCRTTRIDLDITQQELADAVGISRTYLAAIEAGRANPTTGLVERMGDAMDTRFELIAHGRSSSAAGRSWTWSTRDARPTGPAASTPSGSRSVARSG